MIRQLIRTQRRDPLPAAASTLVVVALAAPWLLDFNASHPAVANHIAFAMAFGPLALMVTALRAAAATCIGGGAWLIASPWVLGYASTGSAGWLADLAPSLAAAARRIAFDDGPLPSPAAIAIELSAPIHLEQRERLFAS